MLRLLADRWSAFLVPNAFVEDLPNRTIQSVGDCADRLCMSEPRDESRYTITKTAPFAFTAALAA
jgi:hypothetical protein